MPPKRVEKINPVIKDSVFVERYEQLKAEAVEQGKEKTPFYRQMLYVDILGAKIDKGQYRVIRTKLMYVHPTGEKTELQLFVSGAVHEGICYKKIEFKTTEDGKGKEEKPKESKPSIVLRKYHRDNIGGDINVGYRAIEILDDVMNMEIVALGEEGYIVDEGRYMQISASGRNPKDVLPRGHHVVSTTKYNPCCAKIRKTQTGVEIITNPITYIKIENGLTGNAEVFNTEIKEKVYHTGNDPNGNPYPEGSFALRPVANKYITLPKERFNDEIPNGTIIDGVVKIQISISGNGIAVARAFKSMYIDKTGASDESEELELLGPEFNAGYIPVPLHPATVPTAPRAAKERERPDCHSASHSGGRSEVPSLDQKASQDDDYFSPED